MMRIRQLGLGLLAGLFAVSAAAADLAVLRNGFSMRHQHRAVMGTTTRLYTSADDSSYVDVPTDQIVRFEREETPPVPKAPAQPVGVQTLEQVINQASGKHFLDADLINSVIHAESDFNPRAVSSKGARGLMQLMPRTAAQLGVPNAFDPEANVEGGTRYLRWLLEHYNFDLVKALAAYNAGPERVERYRGVPPYYETQAYVARIIREFNRKKLAEQKAVPASHSARSRSQSRNSRSGPGAEQISGTR